MQKLVNQGREYEDWWGEFLRNDFFHNLQFGAVVIEMVENTPVLKPEALRTANHLRQAFEAMKIIMKKDIGKYGEIRCWQFRRKQYCRFALKVACLSGRLKQAASGLAAAKQ